VRLCEGAVHRDEDAHDYDDVHDDEEVRWA